MINTFYVKNITIIYIFLLQKLHVKFFKLTCTLRNFFIIIIYDVITITHFFFFLMKEGL